MALGSFRRVESLVLLLILNPSCLYWERWDQRRADLYSVSLKRPQLRVYLLQGMLLHETLKATGTIPMCLQYYGQCSIR
jgi:hypothetical protein